MKHNVLYFLTLFSLFCLVSCRQHVETNALNNLTSLSQIISEEVQTDSIVIVDSMRQYGIMAKVSVKADFPMEGNFLLLNSIREWMSEQLGGTFEGTPENGKAMLTHYAQQRLQELNDFSKDFGAEDSSFVGNMVFDTDILFEKIYETDQFVTYHYHNQGYSGGAHGWNIAYGQTFRKSDGRRVGLDFFQNDELDKLATLVKKGILKEHFENDTAEFRSSVLDYSADFPLPQYPPYFDKRGVVFIYQQYEIAAYAVGMPSCLIPYATVEPMLTQAGKMLLRSTPLASN
ncbi:MAG: DUF3298 domain-containing protein [Bacteroidales bacterium]|nr:DUF3298 domain-containing protein [Bacteroidales bacterium]